MYSIGAIVFHPQHRVGVVQCVSGPERLVAFVAVDDQWCHRSELLSAQHYFAREKWRPWVAEPMKPRKPYKLIEEAEQEPLSFTGSTGEKLSSNQGLIKTVTAYRDPQRPISNAHLPKGPVRYIDHDLWLAESRGIECLAGYIQVPLGTQQARNYLGVRFKKWGKKAAETLRKSGDFIWMPAKGFQRTPTRAIIRYIRQRPDFGKLEESVFDARWWTQKILFGPDPADWKESSIPPVQWTWCAQPVSVSARSFGSVSRSEYRPLGTTPYRSTCRTIPADSPHLNRYLDFESLTGPPVDLQFQPYMAVHPFKGCGPDEFTLNTDHEAMQALFAQAGVVVDDETDTEDAEIAPEEFERIEEEERKRIKNGSQIEQEKHDLVTEGNEKIIDPTIKSWAEWRESHPDEELCEHGFPEARHCPFCPIAYLEIRNRKPDCPPDSKYEKCDHGVMWGAIDFDGKPGNCRVCRPIIFRGKKARVIWEAVDRSYDGTRASKSKQAGIKWLLRGQTADFFHGFNPPKIINGNFEWVGPDLAIIRTNEIDRLLGLDITITKPKALEMLIDRMESREMVEIGNRCTVCNKRLPNWDWRYCQDCARREIWTVPVFSMTDHPNTHGNRAWFSETKVRAISTSQVTIKEINLLIRAYLRISQPEGDLGEQFDWLMRESEALRTLYYRYVFKGNTPNADIAAAEGLREESIRIYFARNDALILNALGELDLQKIEQLV
jgi:hypothetical protein